MRVQPDGWEHGVVATNLTMAVGNFVQEHQLGKVISAGAGFVLHRDPVIQVVPDLAFVRNERLPSSAPARCAELAPDLVVEVISPAERLGYLRVKIAEYLLTGVRQVWMVDPRSTSITVHTPEEDPVIYVAGETVPGDDILPGFELEVASVFS